MELVIRPAMPDRWADLTELAGERGFSSGCWCMWWRLSSREFDPLLHDQRGGLGAVGQGASTGRRES